jgi:hypothetical protein
MSTHIAPENSQGNYALQNGYSLERVTLDMVSESDLGVEGYSKMVVSMAKPKAKAGVKKAAAKPKAVNPTLDAEKSLKNLLSLDSRIDNDLKKVEKEFADQSWAASLLTEIQAAQSLKDTIKDENDGFIKSFAAAVLSQPQFKAFKKQVEEWDQTVFNAVSSFKAAVEKYQSLVERASRLAEASDTAGSTPATPKVKKARGA